MIDTKEYKNLKRTIQAIVPEIIEPIFGCKAIGIKNDEVNCEKLGLCTIIEKITEKTVLVKSEYKTGLPYKPVSFSYVPLKGLKLFGRPIIWDDIVKVIPDKENAMLGINRNGTVSFSKITERLKLPVVDSNYLFNWWYGKCLDDQSDDTKESLISLLEHEIEKYGICPRCDGKGYWEKTGHGYDCVTLEIPCSCREKKNNIPQRCLDCHEYNDANCNGNESNCDELIKWKINKCQKSTT